jgi:fused signal recognition particle receptor
MAFFRKLRERLTRSSSKLDEGIADLVASDPVAEAPQAKPVANPSPESAVAPDPMPAPPTVPEPEPEPEPVSAPDPVPPAAPMPDPAPQDLPEPKPEPATPQPAPGAEPERAVAPPALPAPDAAAGTQPAPRRGLMGRLLGGGARDDAPTDPAPEPVAPPPPEPLAPPLPEPEITAAPKEASPQAAHPAADAEAAPAARSGLVGRLFGGRSEPSDPAPVEAAPAPEPTPARPGLIGRLRPGAAEPRRRLDDAMLEELEDLLVAADLGVETALSVAANMAEGRMGRALTAREIKALLAREVARVLEPVARPLPIYPKKPQVVLVVGVNGSGKTTTIGKLAAQFHGAGKQVRIAACDTFRAAAVEQLQVWGERAGVPVMTAAQGADPAALAFDALAQAEAAGDDLLMIDTAGRLQNRADLMAELEKIVRVIRKRDPDAPHNTLLVLDATTGQNALNQVEVFRKMADVTGLIMTKLDGTAKGGVLVALADRFGLPIHAIGVGEQIDDLDAFDPADFANALTGAGAEA